MSLRTKGVFKCTAHAISEVGYHRLWLSCSKHKEMDDKKIIQVIGNQAPTAQWCWLPKPMGFKVVSWRKAAVQLLKLITRGFLAEFVV